MQVVEGLSISLAIGGAVALALGGVALGGSADLRAAYWFLVGAVALRAASALSRTKGSA